MIKIVMMKNKLDEIKISSGRCRSKIIISGQINCYEATRMKGIQERIILGKCVFLQLENEEDGISNIL